MAKQTLGSTAAAWGYKDAEPFGGEKCQQFYGSNCLRWFVTLTYPCLGTQFDRSLKLAERCDLAVARFRRARAADQP